MLKHNFLQFPRAGSPFWRATLLAVALAACFGWAVGANQTEDSLPCDACHDDVSTAASVHRDFGCSDCHSNIPVAPHDEGPLGQLGGAQICAQCHDDASSAVDGSVHAGMLDCAACHGDSHSVLRPSDLASTVTPLKQIQTCGQCHDSPEQMDGYLRSVHGRALVVSGLVNAPSCSDCHGSHAIYAPSEDRAKASAAHVPETCGSCHQYLLATWRDSAHGKAWSEGKPGPVCVTCHSSHRVMEPTSGVQRRKFPDDCGDCHGDRYATYRDSFHGQATDLGFLTAATCSDCHTPHLNLPATDPASSVHPANLAATCGQCHADANESFLTFEAHSDPSSGEGNQWVHWVWLLMTGLLFSVFGFFGVHDLLWAQRSAVALYRGEVTAARAHKNGPYIRRFGPLEVRLHVTIIASFLLLAATGLPLKFHFTEWANDLAVFFGGIDSSRFLHRLAAIVTFGYAAVHLGHLFKRIVLRKEYGLLWGWRSIVPRGQDFIDLWANVKYFLYRGPRPTMSRWSYWEKFDYFAVFWGVAIIGTSGLMLWFPNFFTRFLPGWTLNIAFVIHSDEALLATGFIFVFHFFHTHLRPEVFPMDPVIFTGCMPLEQFKEERPREYKHLVDTGELESCLVEAPSAKTVRRARIFGFSALTVGVALLIGMLLAVILH